VTSLTSTIASDSSTDPEKVVRRAWLDFVDRGPRGMLDHCTDDVCWISLLANGRPAVGRDGIEAMYDGLADIGMSHTAVPYRYGSVNGRVVVSVDVCVTQGATRDPDYHVYVVYHLEGDKISRICEFLTPDEAIAAANED
jgi:ketosteroid isomerase-like protein